MSANRPNLLFITADQWAARFVGCYGSGVPSTPTLDAWAARGMRFERHYAACPICGPNRSIWLTGRSPAVNGMVHNNYTFCGDTPTWAHVLRAHGYRTAGFGKFHQHPMPLGTPADVAWLGFDESVVSEDPKWGPWPEWVRRKSPEHYDVALAMCWDDIRNTGATPELTQRWREARQRILEPIKRASRWGRMYASPLPAELHDSTFIAELGIDFVRRHAGAGRPFACHISFVDPHDPYDPPQPYAQMFDPQQIPAPLPAEWIEQGPKCLDGLRDSCLGFRAICDDPAAVRQMRALYHGSLRFLDDQLARIDAALTELNLWDNTIVLFTTDHGEMMGDHGLLTKGLMHYDSGIRCPLIAVGAGVPAGVTDALTSSLDVYPTLCDLAGVPAEDLPPLEGRSMAPLCRGEAQAEVWTEIAVCFGEAQSVITDDHWRLTRYVNAGEGQMFDLSADPDEQRNLYDDPAFATKRQALFERLVRALARPARTPHYRNLPVIDGRRHILEGSGSFRLRPASPDYDLGGESGHRQGRQERME